MLSGPAGCAPGNILIIFMQRRRRIGPAEALQSLIDIFKEVFLLSSKLLEFLGLSDGRDEGRVVVESHRRSRAEYLKKMQRLVVPEETKDEEISPVSGPRRSNEPYEAVKDDPLTEDIPAAPENEPEQEARQASRQEDQPQLFEHPSERSAGGRLRSRRSERARSDAHSESSFAEKIRTFGRSLRRPEETQQPLVLVKSGAADMIEDIEDALVGGQTVLLDFEKENPGTAKDVISKVVGFVRMHNGVYYTVTRTSLLVALNGNAVIDWLPGAPDSQEQ